MTLLSENWLMIKCVLVWGQKIVHSFSYGETKVKGERLRSKLRQDLAVARRESARLFQMLAPEALYERPIAERHRIVFYLGHLETFDWNMICATSFGEASFNSGFDRLFAFGIDPVGGGLPQDQPSDWPRIQEIVAYNDRVRRTVDELLDGANFENGSEPFVANGQIFHVAIEHRLMHAETLAYMLHWLDYDSKKMQQSLAAGSGFASGRANSSRPSRA